MVLDEHVATLLDQIAAQRSPKLWEMSLQAARAATRASAFSQVSTPIGKVEDRQIPGPAGKLALRIYTPHSAGDAVPGGLVFFHGGGFVICDLDTHDDLCRALANESGCRVIAVDFRMAPEHPFPAAVEDSFAATQWIAAHTDELRIDPNRLAVGGDSAGGNLAAVVCQLARKGGPQIVFQLLIYPITQFGGPDTASMRENAKGYILEKETMAWFTRLYAPDIAHHADVRLSPLLCKDMGGLPPAYVVTAGFDPLRDEGRDYADALARAGVSVTYVNYPGMIHGFFRMRSVIPKAREAVASASAALREGVR